MRIYWFLAAIVLLTYSVYYGVSYLILPTPPQQLGDEEMPLNAEKQIGTSEDLTKSWINTSGSSLSFYINPVILNRTATIGNEYATVLNIGDNQRLKFLIAPDAGRSRMMAPAVFEIYVNGETLPEMIDISDILLQRWSCVTVVKQGRKFNIYVNKRLSVTHTCKSMPRYDLDKSIRIGDVTNRMGGKVALVSLAPRAMSVDDVANHVSQTMDNNGKPYLKSDLPALPEFSFDGMKNLFMCPGGKCGSSKIPGPMDQWNSQYA